MSESDDEKLRNAFDALRRETQASDPSFASLTAPHALEAQRWRRRRRRIAIMAAAIIAGAFIWHPRANNEPDFERFTALTGIDPGQVTWRAPSDFLLEVPGRDLLRKVPLIDIQAPALSADSVRPPDPNSTPRGRSDS